MVNRLYVGNLGSQVAISTLQELFEPYGFVMDVKLVAPGKTDHTLRHAWVTMATDESDLAAARALNGICFQGVVLRVEEAHTESEEAS